MQQNWLSLTQVAQQLGVSERTVYRLMDQRRLHPFKMGKSWRFDQSDVDAYIQSLRDEAMKEDIPKESEKIEEDDINPAA